MIQHTITHTLEKMGYQNISGNTVTADCMFRFKDGEAKFCVIVKNWGLNALNYEEVVESTKEVENKILLTGGKSFEAFYIIITDRKENVEWFQQHGMKFWIADLNTKKLLIYENQPDDFEGLRSIVESELEKTDISDGKYEYDWNEVKVRDNNGEIVDITDHFRQKKKIPIITILLVAINIIVFIIAQIFGNTEDVDYMIKIGASNYEDVLMNGQFYRLFTSMFLHFGAEHLLNNMFMLAVLGNELETKIGKRHFAGIYLVSGLCASIASVVYHYYIADYAVSAGASGAIYGIFGAFIVFMIMNRDDGRKFSIGRIAFIVFLLIFGSFQETVDFVAHIGGFIAGAVLAIILCINKRKTEV